MIGLIYTLGMSCVILGEETKTKIIHAHGMNEVKNSSDEPEKTENAEKEIG